jgi:hypothetical protein
MKIIVYGDSHGSVGWPGECLQHYYGPLLCYTLGKKKFEVLNISIFEDIEDGDVGIFCFGEIDCRCHIKKHIEENNTYQQIIDDLVSNYLETVKLNVEKANKKMYVYIYNVVPPSREKDVNFNHPEFPFVGTDEERKDYTLYFNKKLKEECPKFSFEFFDIYEHYVDSEGFLRRDLADANIHIRDGYQLYKYIEDNIKPKYNDK